MWRLTDALVAVGVSGTVNSCIEPCAAEAALFQGGSKEEIGGSWWAALGLCSEAPNLCACCGRHVMATRTDQYEKTIGILIACTTVRKCRLTVLVMPYLGRQPAPRAQLARTARLLCDSPCRRTSRRRNWLPCNNSVQQQIRRGGSCSSDRRPPCSSGHRQLDGSKGRLHARPITQWVYIRRRQEILSGRLFIGASLREAVVLRWPWMDENLTFLFLSLNMRRLDSYIQWGYCPTMWPSFSFFYLWMWDAWTATSTAVVQASPTTNTGQ